MPNKDKYKNFDDVKCLWMSCGAVDYKICDKEFNCEACEFEKEIQARLNKNFNINSELDSMLDPRHYTAYFSHPHFHFNSGLMVKNFLGDNYYLGIDPFTAGFIDSKSIVTYISNASEIDKNEPLLNISNGWGEVNVMSPFKFRFIEKLDMKNILASGKHWFSIIEAGRGEIIGNSINEKEYFNKFYEVKSYLRESITTSEKAGTTMYDGGTPLVHWIDILGTDSYRHLMERLFRIK